MANTCENVLYIETKINPEKFLVKTKENKRVPSFEKIIPLKDNYGQDSIYNVRGTSCDVIYDGEFLGEILRHKYDKETKTWELEYRFDTKWSPPEMYYRELYDKLIEEDEDSYVVAQYYESGVGFVGERYNGSDTYYDFDGYIEWIDPLEKYAVKDDVKYLMELFEEVIDREEVGEELDKIRDTLNKEDKEYYKKRINK